MIARLATLLGLGLAGIVAGPTCTWGAESATAQSEVTPVAAAPTYSVWGAARESLFGDPYAHPERWRAMSLGTFFTEGWDEPWISPPRGSGGAPRQSWLNAFNGVFYRLVSSTFGWAHGAHDAYSGSLTVDTPLSARLQLQWTIPFVASTVGGDGDRHTGVGDFSLTTRFLLSETQDVTQSFNVAFRTPTGDVVNHNGVASIEPDYEFWANWWRGLVVRGGVGIAIPFNHDGLADAGARTTLLGNLSAGYYFTPHDMAPIGDLVWYVSTNLSVLTDDRGPSNTATLTVTPGFRTYLGCNLYLFGGVEVPTTSPKPFDYQVLTELLVPF
jgi:hypothetical protein